jgi:flagella basal body P-ring formation protein FlgA
MKSWCRVLALVAGGLGLSAGAANPASSDRQDPTVIKQVVEAYAMQATQGLPGRVQLDVRVPDGRVNLAACAMMEPTLAAGSRWWGKANVVVRCAAGANWIIYVPVQVTVIGQYVIAARPIAGNQPLAAADLSMQNGDLAQVGPGVVSDFAQALGKSLAVGLAAGQPLRREALRSSVVLLQGQTVKLMSKGPGFSVSAEGTTVASAREGQVVQVKTPSNQLVSGVARQGGIVEVSF